MMINQDPGARMIHSIVHWWFCLKCIFRCQCHKNCNSAWIFFPCCCYSFESKLTPMQQVLPWANTICCLVMLMNLTSWTELIPQSKRFTAWLCGKWDVSCHAVPFGRGWFLGGAGVICHLVRGFTVFMYSKEQSTLPCGIVTGFIKCWFGEDTGQKTAGVYVLFSTSACTVQ